MVRKSLIGVCRLLSAKFLEEFVEAGSGTGHRTMEFRVSATHTLGSACIGSLNLFPPSSISRARLLRRYQALTIVLKLIHGGSDFVRNHVTCCRVCKPTPHYSLSPPPTFQRLLNMAALTTLPFETLVEILSNLSCLDLCSMTRVSRRFQLISEQLLYKSPCLRRTNGPRSTGSSLGILLRTVLTPGRETLASHVRCLHLMSSEVGADHSSHFSNDTITRIALIASKFGIHGPLKSKAAQLMVLLDLLPRLQVLQLTPLRILCSFTWILDSNIATDTLPSGLQSLCEFRSYPAQLSHVVSPQTLVSYMKLPNIRRITVSSLNRYQDSAILDSAVATSGVTHLRFPSASMPVSVLSPVLLVPIALTHFSYSGIADRNFTLPSFMAALAPLRVSLQSLHLHFSKVEEFQLPYPEGSLRDWPMLQTLSCPLLPLLGKGKLNGSPRLMDVLPVSLREFEVLQDSYWRVAEAVEQIVEMLEQKELVVPRLAGLAVVLGRYGSDQRVNRLEVACKTAGVSFVEESFCW